MRAVGGFVAAKPFRLRGRTYGVGETVDVAGLPEHKVLRLQRRRIKPIATVQQQPAPDESSPTREVVGAAQPAPPKRRR